MSAARMAQKPFTKVTAPKSGVSANSTTGAGGSRGRLPLYCSISAFRLSIAQLAAGGVGGAQRLLILAVVDEQEDAFAALEQQVHRHAA